jgi:hypothetical protein
MNAELNNAIKALELAKECGGELDKVEYASALKGLCRLRDDTPAPELNKGIEKAWKRPDGSAYFVDSSD